MAASALPPPDHLLPFAPTTNIAVPAAGARRKTPSELRQEQLNRAVRSRNSQDGTFCAALPSTGPTADQQKKTYLRLVDTYSATKPHGTRSKIPFSEQKDDFCKNLLCSSIESSRACTKPGREEPCPIVTGQDALPTNEGNSVAAEQQYGKFRNVTQLSCNTKPQASGITLDMAEALKVMAPAAGRGGFMGIAMGPAIAKTLPDSSSLTISPSFAKLSTTPLDLSLKLSARFLSVDSLHWCHSISSASEVEGVKLFVEKFKWKDKDKVELGRQPHVVGAENGRQDDRFGVQFCQGLHSWVHPPPQYLELYELALAGARGDVKKSGIVTTLFRTWEDSFRALYYMFCYKHCNVFYLCTQQSVVMFKRGSDNGSYAYWSRSTRGLRKKLQEQGVEFLMPFYTTDADMSILEDLHELTEFEKLNPGQTRLVDSTAAIDNNSQSLLVFEAGNVHRLFDFLLNYRFLVAAFGNATDLPVLYSPVEFSKASLYTPEVKYKRLQSTVENISKELPTQKNGSIIMRSNEKVSDIVHSIELKGPPGVYITPWVIQAICSVLQKSQKLGFEAIFVTGPLSETLNVAQDSLSAAREVEVQESKSSSSRTYLSDVSLSKSKVIKHLRYSEGFYQANTGGPS